MENDNLTEKIEKLLSDPEGMEKIQSMANKLFGEAQNQTEDEDIDTAGIVKAVNLLKSEQGDSRTGLLLALKPHLCDERAERVDKAVKLLKIAKILPLLSDSDIFKL